MRLDHVGMTVKNGHTTMFLKVVQKAVLVIKKMSVGGLATIKHSFELSSNT